jgi:DNA primase
VLEADTIERVRHQTSLVAVVQQFVRLQKRGRSFTGLCPFHKEKTPSFHVNDERGFYHCFGCKASGDAIRFVQEMQGLSFIDAVRELAEKAGIEIVETAHGSDDARQRAEARRRHQELYDTANAAAGFFETALRNHPLRQCALDELAKRGLTPSTATDSVADALQAFRVGYAPYGWDELAKHLRTLGLPLSAAEAVGLVLPRKTGPGHYDRFRHRLMFAVMDMQGRVIAFSGRALSEPEPAMLTRLGIAPLRDTDKTSERAKYVNSPESPLYKKREILFGLYQARQTLRETGKALVVEGNFDVVSLHARGIKQTIAPLGTAFTPEQAHLVRRLAAEVVLMFDGDSAGRRAVRASREAVRAAQLQCRVANLPDGIDPDELVRRAGADGVRHAIDSSRGLLEYLIDACLDSGFSKDDPLTRAAKIKEVTELIASEADPEVRAMAETYADSIAERLNISDARTLRALAQRIRQAVAAPASQDDDRTPAARRRQANSPTVDPVSLDILGCVLDWPELLNDADVQTALATTEGDVALTLSLARRTFLGQKADSVEEFLAKIPVSIHAFAASRLAAPRHNRLEDARTVLLENVSKLKRLEQNRRRPETIEALQRAAASGNFDAELALLRQKRDQALLRLQEGQAKARHGVGER